MNNSDNLDLKKYELLNIKKLWKDLLKTNKLIVFNLLDISMVITYIILTTSRTMTRKNAVITKVIFYTVLIKGFTFLTIRVAKRVYLIRYIKKNKYFSKECIDKLKIKTEKPNSICLTLSEFSTKCILFLPFLLFGFERVTTFCLYSLYILYYFIYNRISIKSI